MSSNGLNNECEDAEMEDCDGEKAVTMMDVLKEQEDFEEDANAVLGASDDKNCTYSKGYIKRQAIYACMTCCSEAREDPTKRAGVCLACSLNCHENHDLIELYTKRNFRCDCGNPKFNSHPCQFTPNKNDLNDENIYSQNFSGLYCTCHRPYPDPDATKEEEMIQCIICEDWLHASHLDAVVPANDQYTEMICKACMDNNEFLHDYSDLAVNKNTIDVDKEETVDIINTSSEFNETKCNEGTNETDMLKADNIKSNTNIDPTHKVNLDMKMNTRVEHETVREETKNLEQTNIKPESVNEKVNEESSDQTNPQQDKQDSENILESDNNANNKKNDIESSDPAESKTAVANENVSEEDNKIPSKEGSKNKDESKDIKASNLAENENITETEQTEDKKSEEAIPSNDTSEAINPDEQNEEKTSVNEEKEKTTTKSTENANTSDNRTQEQLEEDLLLADPVETVQDNKDDAATISNTANASENKNKSQAMDTTEPEDCTKDKVEKPEHETSMNRETESLSVPKPADEMDTVEKLEPNTNMNNETESLSVPKTAEVIAMVEKLEEKTKVISETESLSVPKPAEEKTAESESESVPNLAKDKAEDNKPESVSELSKEIAGEINQTVSNEENINMETNTNENNTGPQAVHSIEDNEKNISNSNENNITDNIENNTEPQATHSTDENSTENNEKSLLNDDKLTDKSSTGPDVLKRKLSTETTDDFEVKKPKLVKPQCVRPKGVKKIHNGATFWPSNFRLKLCTCNVCISMYKDLSVLFLTDPEDTTIAYERLGKERTGGKPVSQYEKGMAALSSLGHVQQINALTEYGKMRDKLLDFLKTFKERKVIVKEEDIKAFFAGMKPVREPDGVYFCR